MTSVTSVPKLIGLIPLVAFVLVIAYVARGPSSAPTYSYDTGSLSVAAGGHVTIEIRNPTRKEQTVKVLAGDGTGRIAVEFSGPYGGLVYVAPKGRASIGFRCPLPGTCLLSTRLTVASPNMEMTAVWRSPEGTRSLPPGGFKIIEH